MQEEFKILTNKELINMDLISLRIYLEEFKSIVRVLSSMKANKDLDIKRKKKVNRDYEAWNLKLVKQLRLAKKRGVLLNEKEI